MIHTISWLYGQQNVFKNHVNSIFLYAKKPGKSKGYMFLNLPDHIYLDSGKRNGVEFKSNPQVSGEPKTKHKDCTPLNKTQLIISAQIITKILHVNMNSRRNTRIIINNSKNNNKASSSNNIKSDTNNNKTIIEYNINYNNSSSYTPEIKSSAKS